MKITNKTFSLDSYTFNLPAEQEASLKQTIAEFFEFVAMQEGIEATWNPKTGEVDVEPSQFEKFKQAFYQSLSFAVAEPSFA